VYSLKNYIEVFYRNVEKFYSSLLLYDSFKAKVKNFSTFFGDCAIVA